MSAADLMARIDTARNDHQRASDMLAEARNTGRTEEPQPPEPPRERPVDSPGGISDIGHTILDVAGLIPVVGGVADLINAGWYAAEGDYVNAGLSAAGAIPFVGDAATVAKLGTNVAAAAFFLRNTDNAADAARYADDTRSLPGIGRNPGLSDRATEAIQKLQNIRDNVLGKINKEPGHNHYDAARREAAGEVVALRPDGSPRNHIGELQEAYGGLRKIREALEAEIWNPPSTVSERGIEVLYEQRGRVNHEITELRRFLNEIGHPP
ncbi:MULTISPECIES: polymorphic toxin type 28 domain-containing protein [Trichocoleus]|uniref:Polymorphic toxin type 28 domain-containing protein n=1 Tax=Trichocoleus desertorum GB2-A4 TaxID=2933944 RepID=A0ABV0JG61_9CYAN|nr:polymorphic toxin type 28 domain-containing protein [Trichocoleus sp. FACHB-46]MBD1860069.1 hypothetical protein [Trichocoleus sp. FACHB-46]